MKIIKRDEKKRKEEESIKAKKIDTEIKRDAYLSGLKDNKLFQKYVVEEIIDFEIKQAEKGTFQNMEALLKATPEEVKNITLSKSANVMLLNKLKRRMNGD